MKTYGVYLLLGSALAVTVVALVYIDYKVDQYFTNTEQEDEF